MEHTPRITEAMLSEALKMRGRVNKFRIAEIEAGNPALKECKMDIMRMAGFFSDDPTDHLFPEHTAILMLLPFFVALDLVSTIDREGSTRLKRKGVKADAKNDPKNLKYVCDELLNAIGFLTFPSLAPVTQELVKDLLAGVANYIALSSVLRQLLEKKEDWHFVEWSDSIDFHTIPWKNRFPYAVNLIWLSLFITLIDFRVVPDDDADTDQLRFPMVPFYISDGDDPEESISHSSAEGTDGQSEQDSPDCYFIFIHPRNQEDYALAIVGYPYETESKTLEVVFFSGIDNNDSNVKNHIVNILRKTEIHIMENLRSLQNSWDNFIETLGHIPIRNIDVVNKLISTIVSRKYFMRVSLDSVCLRNLLISLDSNAKRNQDLMELCKQYRKYFDKQYAARDIIDAFREAMPFLQGLWGIIAADKEKFASDAVSKYVEQHSNQCIFSSVKEAVSECRKYHDDYDNNGKRDFFEQLLVRLSANKKWQVSRSVIKKLLRSKKI